MRPRLVVFDLDGTLVDSCGDLTTAVNAALQAVAPGADPLPPALVRTFIGSGARTLIRRALAHTGLDLPVEAALPAFLMAYRACLLDTTRLYPGAIETLDALSDRTLAVLTNKPGDMSRLILDGLGVSARFLRILGGGDLPTRKPDPEGLTLLMIEFGATPSDTVLVGDSGVDAQTALAAGVPLIGVTYGFDAEGVRAAAPAILIDDISDLPRVLA